MKRDVSQNGGKRAMCTRRTSCGGLQTIALASSAEREGVSCLHATSTLVPMTPFTHPCQICHTVEAEETHRSVGQVERRTCGCRASVVKLTSNDSPRTGREGRYNNVHPRSHTFPDFIFLLRPSPRSLKRCILSCSGARDARRFQCRDGEKRNMPSRLPLPLRLKSISFPALCQRGERNFLCIIE